MPSKLFRFTHFRKNASANPLVSYTFKTKDLKPFRIIHFQKKGGGWVPLFNLQPHTSNLCSSLSPLDSALTSKRAAKSFTCNTYEKHTQGEGGPPRGSTRITSHQSRITSHRPLPTLNCELARGPLPHQPPLPLLPPMPYNLRHHTGAKQRSIPDEA